MRKATIVIKVECRLDEEHFATWDKLTPEQQAVFLDEAPHCEDSGAISHWCEGCPFCESFDEEMEEDNG